MFSKTQTAFNAGELSPYLHERPEIDKYASGVSLLENFIILPQGGLYRRPGTRYVAEAKNLGTTVRLIPFNFSTGDRFVLEVGNLYIRFFKGGSPLGSQVTTGGSPYEIAAPWLASEVRAIQFVQINDLLYLVHPEHAPRRLARTNDTSWTLTELFADNAEIRDSITFPPTREENTTDITLGLTGGVFTAWATSTVYSANDRVDNGGVPYICASGHTSGTFATDLAAGRWRHLGWNGATYDNVSLTASSALFGTAAGQIPTGAFVVIEAIRPSRSISANITANTPADNANTNVIAGVYGRWNVRTYGTWSATIKIQRAYATTAPATDAGWETVYEVISQSDRNIDYEDEETRATAWYRIVIENKTAHAGVYVPRVAFEVQSQTIPGVVKLDGVSSATVATADVLTMVYSTAATLRWREGAWHSVSKYPRAVAFHEQRLFFAGTTAQPQTLWGSEINNYEYFRPGTEDDDSVAYTLASGEQNQIQWMVSQRKLVMATSGSVWTFGTSSDEEPITPVNVVAKRYSVPGGKHLQALAANEVVLYAERNGRKVREFVYSFENDNFVAPDMTRLADHLTLGGIVEWSYQQLRDQIIWVVTGNGKLIGFTYERQDQVVGWHFHSTGASGTFESVAVTHGSNQNDDLWLIVKRTINGATKYYVEQFDPNTWDYEKTDADKPDLVYLDSAATGTTTALSHLEAATVGILADGATHAQKTVASGSVTLDRTATKTVIGLPYNSRMRPLKFVAGTPTGSSQGREARIHELVLSFFETLGGEISGDLTNFDVIPFRVVGNPMDSSAPLYTGEAELKPDGSWQIDGIWEVRQSDPLPMTLRSATIKYNIPPRP